MRLAKAIANCGVTSRRKAEELIFDGKVKVNNKLILVPQTLVDLTKDRIEVDGKLIRHQEKVYYLLNKPKGYICSHQRIGEKKIIYDLFNDKERIFSVGRLDRDTTGLLIVTNDGVFANKVIHPSSNVSKDYLVKVDDNVTDVHLKLIFEGSMVEDTFVKPKRVTKLRHGVVKVTVMEGKKREVRVLVENAGLKIQSLQRVRIGDLSLPRIPEGTYRPMTEKEKRAILGQTLS